MIQFSKRTTKTFHEKEIEMAYTLTYWENGNSPDSHYELKHIRLKSIIEAFTLALPHNRSLKTSLITIERHRNYKGKK